LFIVNSSITEETSGTLEADGKYVIEMNTLTGELNGYPNELKGEKVSLSYSIPPAGSLLLFLPNIKTTDYTTPAKHGNLTAITPSGPLKIMKNEDNVLTIDFCDLQVGGDITKDLNTYYAADKVFRSYGFKNGNPWNTSVQFKTNIVDRDTFGIGTGFSVTYHFTVKGKFDLSGIKAVVERTDLWTVNVNGTEVKPEDGKWWLDRSFGVFRIGSLVRTGDNTITLKTSPMKIHAEIEPVYILGNFSVKPADKGWNIEAPASGYAAGSWKTQGLPFYSSSMSYSKDFWIEKPDGKYLISLGKWNGTVAEISVNGRIGTLIAFPPYQSDITGLIEPGTNTIEIKVIGSLKNLLGPHHNNPKPGLVSPWIWRNVHSYPPGNEYQLLDYGLMDDFTLLHGSL
jgi:hypothetical protein